MPKGVYKRRSRKTTKRYYKARRTGVATAAQILHESNFKADQQMEVVIGSDRLVRINIDGVCALRVRCAPDCEIRVDQNQNKLSEILA